MLRAKHSLNGKLSGKGLPGMRVFCPEHKKGFFAPRQSPIKCENRGHILGELDFEGDARSPAAVQWQYCCNCEHFCPIGFGEEGLQRCPVCTRRSALIYLCSRCYTVSFESNTPLQTKNFTINSEGVPLPSCPGCLQETSTDLREHTCNALEASFMTALDICPLCEERLDVGPSFPSTVSDYLRRTRSANKVNVTFDYDTGLFVPVSDGEFVLIKNDTETGEPVVVPRSPRLNSKRDFYEVYQDYFHCSRPDAGEVQVMSPAGVTMDGNGWSLHATGILEILTDKPKKTISANQVHQRLDQELRQRTSVESRKKQVQEISEPPPPPRPQPKQEARRALVDALQEKAREAAQAAVEPAETEPAEVVSSADSTLCTCCGSYVEKKYEFCWQCGNRLSSGGDFERNKRNRMKVSFDSAANLEDEELTVQHEGQQPRSNVFSWGQSDEPRRNSGGRSIFKLLLIVVTGSLVAAFAIFALTRSASPIGSATAAQPATTGEPSVAATTSTQTTPEAPVAQTTKPVETVRPEDQELEKLKQKLETNASVDTARILQTFVRTEKRYPNDYRFPYERARLVAKAREATSRNDAFDALASAATKAIKNGKATEMLDGLESDKGGDFHQLSRDKREWSLLTQALKAQDPTRLN